MIYYLVWRGVHNEPVFSTNTTVTVQVPEGCTIPTSGGVSNVYYSNVDTPIGFPKAKDKWRISSIWTSPTSTTSNATFGAFSSGGWALTAPIGSWDIGWKGSTYNATTTTVSFNISPTPLTGLNASAAVLASRYQAVTVSPSAAVYTNYVSLENPQTHSAPATYVMYSLGSTTGAGISGSDSACEMYAQNALL